MGIAHFIRICLFLGIGGGVRSLGCSVWVLGFEAQGDPQKFGLLLTPNL